MRYTQPILRRSTSTHAAFCNSGSSAKAGASIFTLNYCQSGSGAMGVCVTGAGAALSGTACSNGPTASDAANTACTCTNGSSAASNARSSAGCAIGGDVI